MAPASGIGRLSLILAVGVMTAPAVRADVVAGDVVTAESIDQVKDLVSPGLDWCIRHGFPITIVEPTKIRSAGQMYRARKGTKPRL